MFNTDWCCMYVSKHVPFVEAVVFGLMNGQYELVGFYDPKRVGSGGARVKQHRRNSGTLMLFCYMGRARV